MNKTVTRASDVTSLQLYMRRVYNYMATGIGLSALTSYLVVTVPALNALFIGTPLYWVALLAPLVMIFFMNSWLRNTTAANAQLWFWTFCILEGIGLTVIAMLYTPGSMFQIFLVTSAMFGGISLWAYTTSKDLSGWGSFLLMALIGLIVVMVFNIFIANAMTSILISIAAVLLFSALIAYDTQRIRADFLSHGEAGNSAIFGALALYLDFLNLFIHLLHLFGLGTNND